uniref:hypothetical protein n=1 Tax=Herbidospora sakaeratensis TaxID=564415 RepID=UPI000AF4F0E7|nr:hypothetical protein [Herbidospora sakaeratensis]
MFAEPDPAPAITSANSPASPPDPMAEAKRRNTRVEVENLRTEASTTYANPDGKTMRTELHAKPIRVKRDGAWQPIDTTLVVDGDAVRPRATASKLKLSNGRNNRLLGPEGAAAAHQTGAVSNCRTALR